MYQKTITLKKFINENNFSLLISNVARGLDGAILDHDLKQPSLCIPHGIISKSLNNYDLLYKKNIAEAVFNGESNYFAIQSKIMHQSLETHKFRGKPIITGNLIFLIIQIRVIIKINIFYTRQLLRALPTCSI